MRGHFVVTGAAGFIGSHLMGRLLVDRRAVVGVDSFQNNCSKAITEANLEGARTNPAFTLHEANILELAAAAAPGGPEAGGARGSALAALLRGSACVYHLAAKAGACAPAGAAPSRSTRATTCWRRSSCSRPASPPRSPYGATKLAGEHLCGLYHANRRLNTVSLRFFTVNGPRQRPDMAFHKFIKAMLEGREIVIYSDGTQTRDFTHVDDIVEGLVLAQQAPPGATMNPGGGNRVSLLEAVATLGELADTEPKLIRQGVEAGDVRDP